MQELQLNAFIPLAPRAAAAGGFGAGGDAQRGNLVCASCTLLIPVSRAGGDVVFCDVCNKGHEIFWCGCPAGVHVATIGGDGEGGPEPAVVYPVDPVAWVAARDGGAAAADAAAPRGQLPSYGVAMSALAQASAAAGPAAAHAARTCRCPVRFYAEALARARSIPLADAFTTVASAVTPPAAWRASVAAAAAAAAAVIVLDD